MASAYCQTARFLQGFNKDHINEKAKSVFFFFLVHLVWLTFLVISGQMDRFLSEPCGLSGLKIFPLRKFLGETILSNHMQSFKKLGHFFSSWGQAMASWPDISLSPLISFREPSVELKSKTPNDSGMLTDIFSRNFVTLVNQV